MSSFDIQSRILHEVRQKYGDEFKVREKMSEIQALKVFAKGLIDDGLPAINVAAELKIHSLFEIKAVFQLLGYPIAILPIDGEKRLYVSDIPDHEIGLDLVNLLEDNTPYVAW